MYMNTSSILTNIKYILRTFLLFLCFFWAVNWYDYQLLTGYLENFMYILCLHSMIT